jgi:mediator of RNA polymerase II transcription subunit 12
VLSETNVKNGYILGQAVSVSVLQLVLQTNTEGASQVESFSLHGMINGSLNLPEALTKLEQLMNEVFIHRADRMPAVP